MRSGVLCIPAASTLCERLGRMRHGASPPKPHRLNRQEQQAEAQVDRQLRACDQRYVVQSNSTHGAAERSKTISPHDPASPGSSVSSLG